MISMVKKLQYIATALVVLGIAVPASGSGSIVAWGRNYDGQCSVPAPNAEFVAVAAGLYHSLGLKSDGSIVAWGNNLDGQCNVPAPNAEFVAVAAGYYHSLGLKSDGSIVAWGGNYDGQCSVPAPNAEFVAVAGGYYHSLGLKADGSIVAWGENYDGQCNVPPPNTSFVAVAGGSFHSLGLKSDGSIVAWGNNGSGQCTVPAPNAEFVAVAAGWAHSLGLKSDTPTSLSPELASLRVTITPAEAVLDGARWRRAGTSTWRESGETETGVPVGVYRIEFKDLVSWVTLGELVYVSPLGTDAVIQGYSYRLYRPGEARTIPDGTLVGIGAAIISAAWTDVFYIEADDRSSGIRVEKASHGLAEGVRADVIGTVQTNSDGERCIQASSAVQSGSGSIEPLLLANRSVGGGDWNYDPITGAGQKGVTDSPGEYSQELNNIGLLIYTTGRVTYADTDYFYLDDGSKVDDSSGHLGVKVLATGLSIPVQGAYVQVTGVSSCFKSGDDLYRLIRVRDQADIVVME